MHSTRASQIGREAADLLHSLFGRPATPGEVDAASDKAADLLQSTGTHLSTAIAAFEGRLRDKGVTQGTADAMRRKCMRDVAYLRSRSLART